MDLAAALAALAAGSPAPVEVVSDEVVLARHDRAPIAVRCNRRRRACRGVLVLGIERCSGHPVAQPGCQLAIGRRRFAIAARSTGTVTVRRALPAEYTADGPEEVVVRATPHLRRPGRSRRVRLVAPPELPRPELRPGLRMAERLVRNEDAIRFHAAGPRATTSMTVAFDGRDVALHRRMGAPHLLGRRSLAVAGAAWHGELPVERDRFRSGERHPYRLVACDASGCTETRGEIELAPDQSLIPRPICALRPL